MPNDIRSAPTLGAVNIYRYTMHTQSDAPVRPTLGSEAYRYTLSQQLYGPVESRRGTHTHSGQRVSLDNANS